MRAAEQQGLERAQGQQQGGYLKLGRQAQGMASLNWGSGAQGLFTPPGAQCRRHDVGHPRKGQGWGWVSFHRARMELVLRTPSL